MSDQSIIAPVDSNDLKIKLLEEKVIALKELSTLKDTHIREIMDLRWKLSEVAINKAEVTMTERMEASNNKFGLLKDQASTFVTQNDHKAIEDKVSMLTKLVYIGLGIVLTIEVVLQFI